MCNHFKNEQSKTIANDAGNFFHDQHYMTMQPKITSIFLDELGVPRRFALGSLLKTAAAAHTPALPTYY